MTEPGASLVEGVLQRDRLIVAAALGLVIVLAWGWILAGAGLGMTPMATHDAAMSDMPGMSGMSGIADMADMAMRPAVWSPAYALLMLLMWWVMMAAMMLPSATPMILLFARINRRERAGGRPYVPTGLFVGGYLAVWGGFSALAASLQWGLERAGLLSGVMATTSRLLAAAILIAAALWQLTPIKTICLRYCRAPIGFLSQHWRPGAAGAVAMGLRHGLYCLGCCWFLMALLFVGGIMNVLWIAGLAVFVLVEKTSPLGHWFGRLAGIVGLGGGIVLLAGAVTGA